jgi:2',3'-cyclic-nucleotide 2'-phosphodiesterase (5'-nucleotidase family)
MALFLLPVPSPAAEGRLTILHLNDFHGWLLPHRDGAGGPERGGAARLASLVGSQRSGPTLFLAAGDLWQGTNLSNVFAGQPVIEAFNLMGLDASAAGNHEFDNGLDTFRQRAGEARFPFLAANVRGADFLRRWEVRKVGGLTVGLFGLSTPETPVATHPRNVAGLTFDDPVAAAREAVDALRPAADLVVCLSHLGIDEDERLAEAVPGIDVIVGGHTHTRVDVPTRVGRTLVLQAYERGEFLGRLELTVGRDGVGQVAYRLLPVGAEAGEDGEVARLVAGYQRLLEGRMGEILGRAAVDLDGAKERIRSRETNLGNLVADALREAAGAEAAVMNGGGIRAGIAAGPITVGNVYDVLPFDTWAVALRVTGAELAQALEVGLSRVEAGDGGFPQVSGISFTWNPAAPALARLREVRVGGEVLIPDRRYLVATNDFLAAGGNNYAAFAGHELVFNDSGRFLRDVLAAHVRRAGRVDARVEGRIREVP